MLSDTTQMLTIPLMVGPLGPYQFTLHFQRDRVGRARSRAWASLRLLVENYCPTRLTRSGQTGGYGSRWFLSPGAGASGLAGGLLRGGRGQGVLSHVQLFLITWTVAHQAPLSMGFPRQENWSAISYHRGSS